MLELAAVLATLTAAAPAAPPPRPESGTVRSDEVTIEVLAPSSGQEIRTPEGFIRAEGAGPDERAAGSFGIFRSAARGGGEAAAASTPGQLPAPLPASGAASGTWAAPPPPGADDGCRAERERYLRHLWHSAGIDVERPLALVKGLSGQAWYGDDVLAAGSIAGVDPIRPLAWDAELRSLARDLVACRSGGPAPLRWPRR